MGGPDKQARSPTLLPTNHFWIYPAKVLAHQTAGDTGSEEVSPSCSGER